MKKAIRVIIPILLIILIIGSIGWYLFVYDRIFTRDTLLSQARFQDAHGNSRLSSWFYNTAYSFSGNDEDVAIELASQYIAAGNFTKAELTLTRAIRSRATPSLYCALSKVFVAQDKILDALRLLDSIPDPQIKAQIDALRPTNPVPNIKPGYYSDYIDISLSSNADAIFYTTTADYPSISQSPFYSPLSLSAGETTLRAIGVSNSGLVSGLVELNYTVAGIVEEVHFVDPAIEAVVRERISVNPGSPIYSNLLWPITDFTVPGEAVVFDDLAQMPYLQKLTICNHIFDSLEFLRPLNNLVTLELEDCSFPSDNLSIVASLSALRELSVVNCNISSINALQGADHLTKLNLSNNTIRNLEAIATMTDLVELNLQHNAVTSLEDLRGLTNLQTLDLSFNSVTDIAPLVTCSNLNWLSVGNNQVSQLIALGNMPQLTYFDAEYNALYDVSPLAACTNLTSLNIGSNSISDISSLSTLTNLEYFDFSANQIQSLPNWPAGSALRKVYGSYNQLQNIDVLSRMPNISYIYMDYNLISNIDALADCYSLVQVNVFSNPISNVSALRDHDIIVNYDPTN